MWEFYIVFYLVLVFADAPWCNGNILWCNGNILPSLEEGEARMREAVHKVYG